MGTMTARKKKLRKLITERRRPVCVKVREVFDAPVVYGGVEYTEVHVIVNWGGWVLSLYNERLPFNRRPNPVGTGGLFDSSYERRPPVDVPGLWRQAEALVEAAREGKLTHLEDQTWTACLV